LAIIARPDEEETMMFTPYAVAAAAILGAAVGAAASRGLQGKRAPKAYIVTEV
jgi:hypothetical protein